MKKVLVFLSLMCILIIVGAGAASASVIEKVSDVDIGAIELAKGTTLNVIVMGTIEYDDWVLTSTTNTSQDYTIYSFRYSTEVKEVTLTKPFYLSLYNDNHRSDWLNKASLKTAFDTDRQNKNTAYRWLRRVQHRPSAHVQF